MDGFSRHGQHGSRVQGGIEQVAQPLPGDSIQPSQLDIHSVVGGGNGPPLDTADLGVGTHALQVVEYLRDLRAEFLVQLALAQCVSLPVGHDHGRRRQLGGLKCVDLRQQHISCGEDILAGGIRQAVRPQLFGIGTAPILPGPVDADLQRTQP